MGADAFSVWYGLRFEIDVEATDNSSFDRVMEPFETNVEARMVAAHSAGLAAWTDRDTEGGTYYLGIGSEIGRFGGEYLFHRALRDSDLTEIQFQTRAKLQAAGIEGTASLHFQLVCQY